jgi:hypothetical protein
MTLFSRARFLLSPTAGTLPCGSQNSKKGQRLPYPTSSDEVMQ